MTCLKNLATALGLLLLAGCSALSPYSTQTKLQLTLDSNEHLNLDVNGRASPLVLRLYELKHPVAFENADFFSLYERGKDVLAQDLVNSEELELRPGQTMDLKLTVAGTSRYVGVMAAYRDITDTQWRYVITVQPEEITRIQLVLDQNGIHDAAQPVAKVDDRT
ncbi:MULTISPECIES: type VI secretion system lipoprotein TssJ [Pseudomonas]